MPKPYILAEELRELAEWADMHIYEVPIMLPDYLREAADLIKHLSSVAERSSAKAALCEKVMEDYDKMRRERDRYWEYIKGLGCDTCGGDCDRCEVGLDRVWSGWVWDGEKEEERE